MVGGVINAFSVWLDDGGDESLWGIRTVSSSDGLSRAALLGSGVGLKCGCQDGE